MHEIRRILNDNNTFIRLFFSASFSAWGLSLLYPSAALLVSSDNLLYRGCYDAFSLHELQELPAAHKNFTYPTAHLQIIYSSSTVHLQIIYRLCTDRSQLMIYLFQGRQICSRPCTIYSTVAHHAAACGSHTICVILQHMSPVG